MTDSEKYSDGKLEKNPGRGKKNLKPYVYKLLKHFICAIAYFCRTVRRVYVASEVKVLSTEAEGRPSVNKRVQFASIRPETG